MLLAQLVLNGLVSGATYALLAVGFAIIYNCTRIFHIAHGAVFTFAGYALYVVAVQFGAGYWLAVPLAIVSAALLGIAMEVAIYRPLRVMGGGGNSALIASLGMASLIQALLTIGFGTDTRTLREGALQSFTFDGLAVTGLHVANMLTVIVIFPLLQLFLSRTRHGMAIRALADNPALAAAQGIDPGRTYILVYGLGSALAAIAALLVTFDLGVRPDMGFNVVFLAVVAVIIGGVGYLPGALLGAFALGLLQQISTWQIDTAWQNGVTFGVLMLFLIARPQGIFGSRFAVRRA